MSPQQQRAQWYLADARHLQVLRSVTDEQAEALWVPYFAGPVTLTEYAGYRLSEQSLHGWDVTVAFDPGAAIPASELLCLDAGPHLLPIDTPTHAGRITGPADSLLRLVYGRHRSSDPVKVSRSITPADLAALFPGY